jgi:hypothetical protein
MATTNAMNLPVRWEKADPDQLVDEQYFSSELVLQDRHRRARRFGIWAILALLIYSSLSAMKTARHAERDDNLTAEFNWTSVRLLMVLQLSLELKLSL